ncbi:MAG TPA: hypothetical protein VM582_04340 [Candidatus Thermoplasmatota archaeon]|nr:hypothetical protein [Candidatus Thermoplasmatota archaeon]
MMPVWLGALAGVAALLAAAKAHGRQVRLEREAAGYRSVVFGGDNPPFVERLWRRDRLRYWGFVPPFALAGGAAAYAAAGAWPLALVAALLWAPTLGFFFAGLWSFGAQRGRGGVGWWLLAAALAAASGAAAFL